MGIQVIDGQEKDLFEEIIREFYKKILESLKNNDLVKLNEYILIFNSFSKTEAEINSEKLDIVMTTLKSLRRIL